MIDVSLYMVVYVYLDCIFMLQKKKKYLHVTGRLQDKIHLLQAKMEEMQIERDALK